MNKTSRSILVIWDFTQKSKDALQHAVQLSQVSNSPLILLHVIHHTSIFGKSNLVETLQKECEERIDTEATQIKKHYGVDISWQVSIGKTGKIIRQLVLDKNISLVVSPEHYNTRNKVLKMPFILKRCLKNIQIPFIATDKTPVHSKYIEIVVPLDYDKRFKETVQWLVYLSKVYKCNINLIKPFYSDQGKKKMMANNIFFSKKMFDNNNIIYGIKTAKKKRPFVQEVYNFSDAIDADLIMIIADKYNTYLSEDKLHKNSKAPLMCLSPKRRVYQSFT